MSQTALIVGAGPGLSASLARRFSSEGMRVALAARKPEKLSAVCRETGAVAYNCDASSQSSVADLFDRLANDQMTPDWLVFNAGYYERGPIATLDPEVVKTSLMINGFAAMLVAQAAARVMIEKGGGVMLFTGASASTKGFSQSAPFAMGKFALRGLCQSLARELALKNIHVAHFILDGMIYSPERGAPYDNLEKTLHPEDIADSYWNVAKQPSSTWTSEMELRPHLESF